MNIKVFIFTAGLFLFFPGLCLAQVLADSDGDGLNDLYEIQIYYTDHKNPDTDGDGFSDGEEIKYGYSPLKGDGARLMQIDSDGDNLNDNWELLLGTDLMDTDTDHDGYSDGQEVLNAYDPLDMRPIQIEKLIKVNIKDQSLSYYFGDKMMDSFKISSGVRGMDTPVGDFEVMQKFPTKHYGGIGYDYPNTKWNLLFTKRIYGYYIHGAYWHNNFGHPMSHGCVNVAYENMEPLYWWSQVGTKIVIE
ncbi:L,D-transpeptidase [Patescibacteria group bacterium]|nr:L,D-transpeptidase [Patescibacteria group bacterium]